MYRFVRKIHHPVSPARYYIIFWITADRILISVTYNVTRAIQIKLIGLSPRLLSISKLLFPAKKRNRKVKFFTVGFFLPGINPPFGQGLYVISPFEFNKVNDAVLIKLYIPIPLHEKLLRNKCQIIILIETPRCNTILNNWVWRKVSRLVFAEVLLFIRRFFPFFKFC